MKKLIKNENGFSLIEAVIALGLMGVSAMIFMHMQDQVSKQEISSKTRFDEQTLFSTILTYLRSDKSCNFMIGSYCDDLSDKSNPLACTTTGATWVQGVQLGNYSGEANVPAVKDTTGKVMYQVGQKYGNSTLKEIKIRNLSNPDGGAPTGGIGKGRLEFLFARDNPKFLGAPEQKRYVDVSIKLASDGKVAKCVSSGFNDIIPTDRLYININQTSPVIHGSTGSEYRASCDSNDLLLGGDCIQRTDGVAGDLVQGDGILLISGTPNCSGCPNDAANCDSECFNNEFRGYSCFFYNRAVYVVVKPDGTEEEITTAAGEIPLDAGSKIKVVLKTYEQMGGTTSRGARALCLDRD